MSWTTFGAFYLIGIFGIIMFGWIIDWRRHVYHPAQKDTLGCTVMVLFSSFWTGFVLVTALFKLVLDLVLAPFWLILVGSLIPGLVIGLLFFIFILYIIYRFG